MPNTKLALLPGAKFRTAGVTYEVTKETNVPSDVVEVKPQSTRMRKVYCTICGYTCRITQRWIEVGIPACPTCCFPMTVEEKAEKPVVAVAPAKPLPAVGPVSDRISPEYFPEEYLAAIEAAVVTDAPSVEASEPESVLAELLAELR